MNYKNNILHVENVAIPTLAKEFGTPFYCYSATHIKGQFAKLKNSFSKVPVKICYAIKACSNIAIIKLLGEQGAGADTVSEGEIRRAILAGISPKNIVFSGVGKTKSEMKYALEVGIGQFNVESQEELEILDKVAASIGKIAPVAIRVNPDVDAKTHEKISTGRKTDKFGIAWEAVIPNYQKAHLLKNVDITGITTHIGSQLTDVTPYKMAFKKMREMVIELRKNDINITKVDLGGGIGIKYKNESEINLQDYANEIENNFADLNVEIELGPGRFLVGNSGILVTEVQFVKHSEAKNFVIVDAAMNDLARPAMYDAFHEIATIVQKPAIGEYDVVGPVCESSDILGKNRQLPELESGDLIAIFSAGAYGSSMSSTYNTRNLLPEILVENEQYKLIKKRQTYEQIFANEIY